MSPQILNASVVGAGPKLGCVYVGRSGTRPDHYGNPFGFGKGGIFCVRVANRQEAIKAYAQWLQGETYQDVEPTRRQWILDNLQVLKGKNLICWCAPLACHAEVLMAMVNQG